MDERNGVNGHLNEKATAENSSASEMSQRAYELESGADIVLTFEVRNYQAFEQDAINDPVELAKFGRPKT